MFLLNGLAKSVRGTHFGTVCQDDACQLMDGCLIPEAQTGGSCCVRVIMMFGLVNDVMSARGISILIWRTLLKYVVEGKMHDLIN